MKTLIVAPSMEMAWAWAHLLEQETPEDQYLRENHHAAYSEFETWKNKHVCVDHKDIELGCLGVVVDVVYLHNKSWSLHNYTVAISCLKAFMHLDASSDGEFMVFRGRADV